MNLDNGNIFAIRTEHPSARHVSERGEHLREMRPSTLDAAPEHPQQVIVSDKVEPGNSDRMDSKNSPSHRCASPNNRATASRDSGSAADSNNALTLRFLKTVVPAPVKGPRTVGKGVFRLRQAVANVDIRTEDRVEVDPPSEHRTINPIFFLTHLHHSQALPVVYTLLMRNRCL